MVGPALVVEGPEVELSTDLQWQLAVDAIIVGETAGSGAMLDLTNP